jgi:hypothetical protein
MKPARAGTLALAGTKPMPVICLMNQRVAADRHNGMDSRRHGVFGIKAGW